MRTFYLLLFMSSCLVYSCLETDDFEIITENQGNIALKNPIRFDQLAVGQKSLYTFYELKTENGIEDCQPNFDTLSIEIVAADTNGYLVKEVLKDGFWIIENGEWKTVDTLTFYLRYLSIIQQDTLEGIPPDPGGPTFVYLLSRNIEPDDDYLGSNYSNIFGRIGSKIYLGGPTAPSEVVNLESICDLFFLPPKENDPFKFECCGGNYSVPGILMNHSFDGIEYGQLLLTAHDFGYNVDNLLYNFGYTLESGIVFTSVHRVNGKFDEVWHIVPDN